MTLKEFLQTFDEFAEMSDDELLVVLMKKIPCRKCRFFKSRFTSNYICKNPTKPYDDPEKFVEEFGVCKKNLSCILHSYL